MKPPRREKYEREIEKYLHDQCALNKLPCFKLTGTVGLPDRVILAPHGVAVFVEVKAESGVSSDIQKVRHAQFADMGFIVRVVYSHENCDSLIYSLLEGIKP